MSECSAWLEKRIKLGQFKEGKMAKKKDRLTARVLADVGNCQCDLCKRHKRLKKIIAKLPKKDADDLRDIIEGLECSELDLEVWECKANGSWPGWKKFAKIYKEFVPQSRDEEDQA